MAFNSFVFVGLFLPITLLLFWVAPTPSAQRSVLLCSSLLFYGYLFPWYLLLLIVLVGIAWFCSLRVEVSATRWPVWLAALLLLGTLGFYKYAGFFAQIGADIGLAEAGFRVPDLALPLGISFIVFQALGYVIDVQRREFVAEKNFAVVLLFKAFFPQLIAGPICRAHELMPQLKGCFTFHLDRFTSGLAIFALGMLLKAFLADGLAPLVDQLYLPKDHYAFADAWAASIGFGGQIYADFWAYSTMAVGLARMFGIEIPVNFRLPYLSTSLREFWRRWHITLSQWLRDYVYKPLGGSHHGAKRTFVALMLTMLLGGLWHGANYTFIVWGAIHGVALALEHGVLARKKPQQLGSWSFAKLLGWGYTFLVVFIAWVFFRAVDVTQAVEIVVAMFTPAQAARALGSIDLQQIWFLVGVLVIAQVPVEWLLGQLRREKLGAGTSVAIAFWSLVATVVLGAPVAVPFIYFQF